MQKNRMSGAGFPRKNAPGLVRSAAWGKSLAVSCGAFLMAVSCSNATESLTIPNSVSSKRVNSDTANQIASSSALSLELAQADASTAPTDLLKGFAHVSFVDNNLLVGSSAVATGALAVADGKISAQAPLPVPAFAAGQVFLPLQADGAEFWLVESREGKTAIARSSEPASVPLGQGLPKSVKVTLDSPASLIGFSKRGVLLTTSSSLWIVEFSNGKLTASSVAFPSSSFKPIAGGNLSGLERGFWIAEAKTLWSFTGSSDNWSIRKFDLKISSSSIELKKLAAVIELANGKPKLSGPAVAVGDKVYLAGISAPKLNPPANPGTPNVGAMTFAEAAALCSGCHASTSTNTLAKAKLSGTENISTWVNNKDAIIATVRDRIMPPGPGLVDPNKTRFLNFAQDPKP